MLICGIKVSHDGGIAVIDDNRLVFSIEMEKLGNGNRYSPLGDLASVTELLQSEGIEPADVDRFVVDGWFEQTTADRTAALESQTPPTMRMSNRGVPAEAAVAPYQDRPGVSQPMKRYHFREQDFDLGGDGYSSYHHISNHLLGGYCSSPFAARGEDAMVLVWDGGSVPRLYHVKAATREVAPVANLFPIYGGCLADFSSQFEPFLWKTEGLSEDQLMQQHLSIAGKAMAFAALGKVEVGAYSVLGEIFAALPDASVTNARIVGEKIAVNRDELMPGLSDADLIATFQAYIGERLLRSLEALARSGWVGEFGPSAHRLGELAPNLVMSGGCALNIKWNSLLRESGLFEEIWVPPFANDSGAAIGTASCEMFYEGRLALEWNVYSGPKVLGGDLPAGWHGEACDERQLAHILHHEGEPVVVLSGRAEIGPRALGNRSILAPATSPTMKDRLNAMKDRAGYRPVAPICLTSRAAEVFNPGGHDPYMLFEHRPRPEWADRIPAVLHLDGTARLQTIDAAAGNATSRILAAYEEVSGIPVLCNTSANFNGLGFFPDVASAAHWGGARYIWSEGILYSNSSAQVSAR
ncbi:carbamoyltransferase N-terminal domain-containing protein [Nocardia sp. NPDC004604]|uniref:carbamoyltransferase N-terminal domain-containing protein n=1 Tax=Nocardia sp. NPDC004604 TaxID=3157013 RepID=UPI0033B434FC